MKQEVFPTDAMAALGYESAHFGQGQWNGVAILSKVGLTDVIPNFAEGIEQDAEARIITATCAGIRVSSVYVPNGRALDNDHYQYKLSWMNRLRRHLNAQGPSTDNVIVTGDFNIAPDDRDVWDIKQFDNATHVSQPERDSLSHVEDFGLVDSFRKYHDDAGLFSWWDYRGGSFHKGHGMRIDLVLASESVMKRATWAGVDRNARKGETPSDHVPAMLKIDD